MIFSKGEIIAFNSILDSKEIPGIKINMPPPSEYNQMIMDVQSSFREKRIVDENGKLTYMAVLPIRSLDDYKAAGHYLYFNDMRISFNKDKSITIIKKLGGDSYDMLRMNRDFLFLDILKQCDYLCGAYEPAPQCLSKETMSYQEWENTISDVRIEDILALRNVDDVKEEDVFVFYWKGSEGYVYDLENKERTALGSRNMRIAIAKRLGYDIEGGDEYVW